MFYDTFGVMKRHREPLVEWMIEALEGAGCRILKSSGAESAPFRITFETRSGERLGILAYAFLANSKLTKNRPQDEHRFQVKYGSKRGGLYEIAQDPYQLYTTLFFGINLKRDFFVAADPLLHNPTRFFISIEFKESNARLIERGGWASWEREKKARGKESEPIEVLVGGRKEHFLRLIRFERLARGLDQGHRQLAAELIAREGEARSSHSAAPEVSRADQRRRSHVVSKELGLDSEEILDLIESAPRLKMAVRGWAAEVHLANQLAALPGVQVERIESEGGADLRVRHLDREPFEIECKNVLRQTLKDGTVRLDFQRTRSSKSDPCTRYYSPSDFDIIAACLHSQTERWQFVYLDTRSLTEHPHCPGKLDHRVRLDDRWLEDPLPLFEAITDST